MTLARGLIEIADAAGLVRLSADDGVSESAFIDLAEVTEAQHEWWKLGRLAFDDAGNLYRYVRAQGGRDIAIADALKLFAANLGQVTSHRARGLQAGAGVATVAAIPNNDYGWIQVTGIVTVSKTAAAIAQYATVSTNQSDDHGAVKAYDASTDPASSQLGWALAEAALNSDTVEIFMRGVL